MAHLTEMLELFKTNYDEYVKRRKDEYAPPRMPSKPPRPRSPELSDKLADINAEFRGQQYNYFNRTGKLNWVACVAALSLVGSLLYLLMFDIEGKRIYYIAVLVLSFVLRRINWKGFTDSIYSTTSTTAMILIIVLGAVIFNKFIAVTRVPFALADWVVGLNLPPLVIMLMIIFVYLIGGCFMDALGLILLTVPIFFPVAMSLGFNPIWFGIIITRVSEIGVITPPVGMNVYVMKGVATDVPLATIFKGIFPFLLADLVSVMLLVFIPQISLYLPSIIRY